MSQSAPNSARSTSETLEYKKAPHIGELSCRSEPDGIVRDIVCAMLVPRRSFAFTHRHAAACLSLVVEPLFHGFVSHRISTNKKIPPQGKDFFIGEPDGIRTHDPLIKSQMLYRLSYGPSSTTKQSIIDKKQLVNKKNSKKLKIVKNSLFVKNCMLSSISNLIIKLCF